MPQEQVSQPAKGQPAPASAGADAGATATEILVDGVKYTPADIQRLREKGDLFEKDYRKKTEAVSTMRKASQAREAELQAREARLAEQEVALREDFDFFTTKPREEWDGYQPKVIKVGAPQRPDHITPKLEKIEQALETITQRTAQVEAEKNVDAVFASVETALGEFELCSERALLSSVTNFSREQERTPTAVEVKELAREIHQDLARKGVTLQKRVEEPGAVRDVAGARPPEDTVSKQRMPDLRHIPRVIDSAEKWLEVYRARQGQRR